MSIVEELWAIKGALRRALEDVESITVEDPTVAVEKAGIELAIESELFRIGAALDRLGGRIKLPDVGVFLT